MLTDLVLEEGDRFRQHGIILCYERSKPADLLRQLATLGFKVVTVGIKFKESIREHERNLIGEIPNLDFLRHLVRTDPL